MHFLLNHILVFRYLHCSKSGLYYRNKKTFVLINDWENFIGYGKNLRKAWAWLLSSAIRFILQIANGCRGRRLRHRKNLYPHLCLEAIFPALKLTQNCYLDYNINIFS